MIPKRRGGVADLQGATSDVEYVGAVHDTVDLMSLQGLAAKIRPGCNRLNTMSWNDLLSYGKVAELEGCHKVTSRGSGQRQRQTNGKDEPRKVQPQVGGVTYIHIHTSSV